MKNMSNEQFEQEMNIISNLKEVSAPYFFYTRLKARMEKETTANEKAYPLKPIIVICALTLFLFINSLLLKNDSNIVNTNSSQEMEAFAASYDQTISN
jgi:hypothetical protein